MTVTGCGGSRLSHSDIVSSLSGDTRPAAAGVPGATATIPQNGVAQPLPGTTGTGSVSGGAAGNATPVTGGTAAGTGAVSSGGNSSAGAPAVGSAPTAARPAGPLAPIVLGNVGTYSGPVGGTLYVVPTMLQVWVAWTNAHGGIAGHPVQIISADDGGDPARSRSEVQDLVENKHVIGFLANFMPLNLQGPLPYLEQKHMPVVGGDEVNSQWTSSPVLFPVGTTFNETMDGTLREAHAANATKVGIIACVEAATCDVQAQHITDASPRFGEQVVYTARVSLAQPDFTAQCLGAQQAGAQVIWIGMEANSAERLANSCARQNYHPLWITGAIATTNREADVPALDGLLAPASTFPAMLTGGLPGITAYQDAIHQYAPNLELSGATSMVWTSGQLLAKAMANIGAQPTTDAIFKGLWSTKNETVGGLTPPVTYVANQATPPISCYFVVQIKGGRWTAPKGSVYQCP
jgi:branched-chain amino acid transport system substrate-binding protein